MTVGECAADCLLVGYPFFGLIDGDSCWCDNALTRGSTKGSGNCGVTCVGNTTQTCGGSAASNYMDVWGWPTAVIIASS
jgi:glucan endo-1,3-alpha-glucosidase